MIIDLTHNKIVADTMSVRFSDSVRENLVPQLLDKYSNSLVGIQMYEDYIADDFTRDGYWYYPLTVVTVDGVYTEWIKWQINSSDFEGGVPYAYVGDGFVEFSLADNALTKFEEKLVGRARFCEAGLMKIRVDSTAKSPTLLSGKYSQTFIDEMARQLTPAIEKTMSVEGLSGSNIEFTLTFAPGTYMEHISENVTYRRLILTDKSSAPRDFWIKWTRLDGAVAYSVSAHVGAENILFELGEDVPQKIREKEYRYLVHAGKDKYHNAMSRKSITEWREIIKRALRRGELTPVETVVEIAKETEELEQKLAAVLGIEPPIKSEETVELSNSASDELVRIAEKVRREVEELEPIFDGIDDEDSEGDEYDELHKFYAESETDEVGEGATPANDEERAELDEITRLAMEALKQASADKAAQPTVTEQADADDEVVFEIEGEQESTTEDVAEISVPTELVDATAEIYDEYEEIDDEESLEAVGCEETLRDVRALEPDDDTSAEPTPSISEDKLRRELEAKIRLEYESLARARAEEEAAKLRREQEQLRLENERIIAEARREQEKLRLEYERLREQTQRADAEIAEREVARRAEEERMRSQIEMQMRAEARERERLAEAARLAIEEQRRMEAERQRAERERAEEERHMAEARRRAEAAARTEAARIAEAERIRLEAEARAKAAAAMPEVGDGRYSFTSKMVKLIFRKSVDPNITARIHEVIKATIEYYGKEKVYLKIKATVPDTQTVCLEFVKIPIEEMELLSNIIKILGNSGLGIAKAIVE